MIVETLHPEVFALGAIAAPFLMAFTRRIRREIGERDNNWECQGLDDPCTLGKNGNPASYPDGYWVMAAHYDHDRESPDYDNPDNGRILCTIHHALEHLEMGQEHEAQMILNHGIYIWDEVRKTGKQIMLTVEDLMPEPQM
jgi:hypothetical protein